MKPNLEPICFDFPFEEIDKNDRNASFLTLFIICWRVVRTIFRGTLFVLSLKTPSRTKLVWFSNWSIDAAKMNRAILHNCPTHSHEDLVNTGKAIVESSCRSSLVRSMLKRSLEKIARACPGYYIGL